MAMRMDSGRGRMLSGDGAAALAELAGWARADVCPSNNKIERMNIGRICGIIFYLGKTTAAERRSKERLAQQAKAIVEKKTATHWGGCRSRWGRFLAIIYL